MERATILRRTYLERPIFADVFGGSPSLICAIPTTRYMGHEMVNDLNQGLVDFLDVIRTPELFARFRELYLANGDGPAPGTWDSVRNSIGWQSEAKTDDERLARRAFQWYCVSRAAFTIEAQDYSDGVLDEWEDARDMELVTAKGAAQKRRLTKEQKRRYSEIKVLLEIAGRVDLVQWDHRSWRSFIKTFDRPDTLFYIAPDKYFEEHKHIARRHADLLVDMLLDVRGTAVLFGRERAPYAKLEAAGWEKQEIEWMPPCRSNPRMFRLHRVGRFIRGRKQRDVPRYVWVAPHKEPISDPPMMND